MKKRILTVLLAVCLVFALGTVSALADGSETFATELPRAEGGVITLDKNVVLSEPADIEKDTVLNLGNFSITASEKWSGADYLIGVRRGATLTIKGDSEGSINAGAISCAVKLTLTGENEDTGAARLIVNGGSLTGHYYGIAGNGTRHNTVITINGGNITGKNGAGIYHPQDGEMTIKGGNITGLNTAVEIRSGELTISGGNFTSTAPKYSETPNGNGTTVSGAAIAVSQHTTKKPISVSITGGTFTGPRAFSETKVQNQGSTEDVTIDIDGGTFKGEIKSDDCTGFISGGFFFDQDENPNVNIDSKYFPTGSSVTIDAETGEVVNNDTTTVATVDGVGYPSLQKAINAANAGDKVELLKDITIDLNGIDKVAGYFVINKGITLEGHNNTITASSTVEGKGQAHVIVVSNGNVTIQNLDIDGGNHVAHYGIQAVGANTTVNLKNVYVFNCNAYGAFANRGATVIADGLNTKGSGWGGVNVDTNGGNSKFVMNSGTLAEEYSVVIENSTGASATTTTTLNNGTFNKIQVKTGSGETNNLTINGGRYTDIVGDTESSDGPVKSQTKVTAGTFDNPVDDVAQTPDYRVDRTNGTHNYYKTIERAMNNANPGDDIEYLGSSRTYEVEFVYSKSYSSTVEVIEDDYIELPGGKYDGKEIAGWTRGSVTYKVGDDVKVDRNMTFYVVLKDGEFDIVIDSKIEHGDISTNVNSADKGDTVYIYVDPDTGYVLDDIDVYYCYNYRNSVKVSYVRNNTYRFEMPNADVYITATFKANGMPFVDVRRTQWFYDSIYYVWSNDMMEGDSATTFNPDGTMTRAMFWAVLGRMDGQTITGTNWVEQARNWAMREGVSDGTNPNDYVTREQMVTMLWRYAGEKNGSANLNRYTDSGSVSGYAVEAMRWAIGNGVIQGVTSTTLAPKANATRAECATIFMRFDKM